MFIAFIKLNNNTFIHKKFKKVDEFKKIMTGEDQRGFKSSQPWNIKYLYGHLFHSQTGDHIISIVNPSLKTKAL